MVDLCTIIVLNLKTTVGKIKLLRLFSSKGSIRKIELKNFKYTQRCIITYMDAYSAQKAINDFNNTPIDGRPMGVRLFNSHRPHWLDNRDTIKDKNRNVSAQAVGLGSSDSNQHSSRISTNHRYRSSQSSNGSNSSSSAYSNRSEESNFSTNERPGNSGENQKVKAVEIRGKPAAKYDLVDISTSLNAIGNIFKEVIFTEEHTRSLIRNKFGSVNESCVQLITDSYKLTLICPLTKKRIQIPARGCDCTHIECFDLEPFIAMCTSRSYWHCPICSKQTPISGFRIDIWFLNLCSKMPRSEVTEIELLSDGSWNEITEAAVKDESFIVIN